MNLYKKMITITLTCIFTTNIYAQIQHSELKNELHNYLSAIHSKNGFNGEILVAEGENIIFQEAIGQASIENNIPLKAGAKYRIASVTKTFTGLLFARAQEEGKLDYEDKAIQYIKDLSPDFKDITIYQLLTHTSGLPHNEAIQDYWLVKSKTHLDTKHVIAEINKLPLLFESGTEIKYTSLGYYVLGTILENIYNDSYQNIIKEKVLDKLQMSDTDIINSIDIIPGMAQGYHFITDDSLVVAPYRNYSMLKGAGDLYSTSLDLLKWINSFSGNKLIQERTKKFIFQPAKKVAKHKNNDYGLGWSIDNGKLKKYYHGGGTWGYSSYLALYPKNKISIILLSNVSLLPTRSIGKDIENLIFRLPFEVSKAEQKSVSDLKTMKLFCGLYKSETSEMKLKISDNGNDLYAQLGNNPSFQIYPKGGNQFFGKKINILFTFRIKGNTVTGLTVKRAGQVFNFIKL